MRPSEELADLSTEAEPAPEWEETRRSMLAKAGLVAGVAGLASLSSAASARASHVDPVDAVKIDFDGFNNVKHFSGANDTERIQNCINASASSDPALRKTVYFPPGTYVVTAALLLPSNSVLVGHGPLSVIKRANAGAILTNQFNNGVGNNDIYIDNLTLDGSGSPGAASLIKITAAPGNVCERIFITRVEARDSTSFAIQLKNVKVGAVRGCYVHKTLTNPAGHGIHVDGGSADVAVEGNLVKGCGDDHIGITGFANEVGVPRRISVVGNVCNADRIQYGGVISVRGGAQIEICGNVCRAGNQAGIVIASSLGQTQIGQDPPTNGPTEDIEISGNLIVEAGNTQHPSPLNYATGRGNGILIQIPGTASNPHPINRVQIRNNLISAPGNHGVMIANSHATHAVGDVSVSGNRIWVDQGVQSAGSGMACIAPVSAVRDVRIDDNDIRTTKGAGIRVEGSNNQRWDIRSNAVFDSGIPGTPPTTAPGMVVDGAVDVTVIGNRAQDTRSTKTQSYGLSLKNETGQVLVTNNNFANNANHPDNIERSGAGPSTYIMQNLGADPETALP